MNESMSCRARHGVAVAAVALAALALAGCGGGGGGSTPAGGTDASGGTGTGTGTSTTAEISSTALESSASPVLATASDIDDTGRVAVLFAQSSAGRVSLQAAQGVPNARGVAPTFSQPEVIDTLAPYDSTTGQMGLTLSPAGNAVARWVATQPCTALTYNTTGNCTFVYTARRMAGGTWEAPVLVGDTPGTLPKAIINDAGDVALLWPTWRRDAQNVLTLASGVRWKTSAASQYTSPTVFDDIQAPPGSDVGFTLDRLGNMVYLSLSTTVSAQKTVVARRGSFTAGFGATERLDTQGGDAVLEGLWGGVNGQAVVFWQQASGGQTLRWSGVLDGPTQAWQVASRGVPVNSSRVASVVTDAGNFLRYDLVNCTATRRTAGVWSEAALPAGTCPASTSFLAALSRTGSMVGALTSPVATAGNTGQWLSYNAATNTLAQALSATAAGYLYGTASTVGGSLLLSENGVAALVSGNDFDVLPTAAAPAGTRGSAANLWVTYLKLP